MYQAKHSHGLGGRVARIVASDEARVGVSGIANEQIFVQTDAFQPTSEAGRSSAPINLLHIP